VHPNSRSSSSLASEEFKFKMGEDGLLRGQSSTPDTLSQQEESKGLPSLFGKLN